MNGVQVAVLPGGAGRAAVALPAGGEHGERGALQLVAFAALGLYGVLRWSTLLNNGSTGRLVGLLALGTALAAAGPLLAGWSRWVAALMFVAGALAALAIAGLPLGWISHARVAVSGRAVGQGLSALPEISVPYGGVNQWVRITILLGAAILLLDAALVLTFVPRRLGQLRLAGAALPLLALSVIPATAIRPALPYLEGVLLFALLVAFVWAQRLENRRLGGAVALCGLAAAVAAGLAPSIDRHQAWIDYRSLAASLAPGGVETFNWTQGYGPLHWPHTGRAVLEIQASHPEYWKAENLDVFNGQGWVSAQTSAHVPWEMGISPSSLGRWTQTLQVTVDSMVTSKVIAAGEAYPPSALAGGAVDGTSPGTWQSPHRLRPGASYRIRAYVPNPSTAQLESAGTAYPSALAQSYLSMAVPQISGLSGSAAGSYAGEGFIVPVVFRPFADQASVTPGDSAAAVLHASPYARVYTLAEALRAATRTPYQYVRRVEGYLSHGYRYSQTPPTSPYPLEDFLFVHRLGYCQHFAGAMALLLRMGGVPARVAVGFTSGTFDSATRRWVVSDLGAHAWVEVWFPHYGWVRFDPTPSADPALSTDSAVTSPGAGPSPGPAARSHHREIGASPSPARAPRVRKALRGGDMTGFIVGPSVFLALVLILLLTRARAGQDPLAELSRAFSRTGRPLRPTSTLSGLEARLAHSPEAAAYVRSLRLARFGRSDRRAPGAAPAAYSLHGRRALRAALGGGLGPLGRARAWWALPPRWGWPGRRQRGRGLVGEVARPGPR